VTKTEPGPCQWEEYISSGFVTWSFLGSAYIKYHIRILLTFGLEMDAAQFYKIFVSKDDYKSVVNQGIIRINTVQRPSNSRAMHAEILRTVTDCCCMGTITVRSNKKS